MYEHKYYTYHTKSTSPHFFLSESIWSFFFWLHLRALHSSRVLSEDATLIPELYDEKAKNTVFAAPNGGANDKYDGYFSNFYNGDQECRLGVIECCYTAIRNPPSKPDLKLENNAQMCALDLTLATRSNHIQSPDFKPSFNFYGTQE